MIYFMIAAVMIPVAGKMYLVKRKEDIASFCERKNADLFVKRLLNRKNVHFIDEIDTFRKQQSDSSTGSGLLLLAFDRGNICFI